MICIDKNGIFAEHTPRSKYMKKIRYLRIQFAPEITNAELPLFRGAIVAVVGRANTLFHNHTDDGFRYSYPLIQYKRHQGRPVLVCLESGTDQIHALFSEQVRTLRLGSREIDLSIENINLREHTLQLWDTMMPYRIYSWIALQGDKYRDFQQMTTDTERVRLLESTLRGNILSMAKGLDWFIEGRVEVEITHFDPMRPVIQKDVVMSAFSVSFRCNVSLPDSIGLGKGAARGFGVVKKVRVGEVSLTNI